MNVLVNEVYIQMNKRINRGRILVLFLVCVMTVMVSTVLGNPFTYRQKVGSLTFTVRGWISQKFILWLLICFVAVAIVVVWQTRYAKKCFQIYVDLLENQCDVVKTLEIARKGIEYGKNKLQKKDKLALNYFEKIYVSALNANCEYEEALRYLNEEWSTKRIGIYKNILLETKLNLAFLKKEQRQYLELYNDLLPHSTKYKQYTAYKKIFMEEYSEAIELLEKVETKTLLHNVENSYVLMQCFVELQSYSEAEKCIEYIIEKGNTSGYKRKAEHMYQALKNKNNKK